MRYLSIDIETFSGADLAKCGVYRYAEDEDFEILLLGYAFDDEPPGVIDLKCGEEIPGEIMNALYDENITKCSYNANFERVCLSKYLGKKIPIEQWRCTAVHALMLGLPQSLEGAASALKLNVHKLKEGEGFIKYFSSYGKYKNGGRVRHLPEDDLEKWEEFKRYCKIDVLVEREIRRALLRFPVSKNEQRLWCLDQRINDTGVMVEENLIKNALDCDFKYGQSLLKEASDITGIENPRSTVQLRRWLKQRGIDTESLSKEWVLKELQSTEDPLIRRVLTLRCELSKTSVKKYEAMERAVCRDGRIRGLLQFYGANRTGRWAGRLVQVQNLPQNKLKDLSLARELLMSGSFKELEFLYESVHDVLSQLIRTSFVPGKGLGFIIADYSAIEARIIAWLAGESWRMEVFKGDGRNI